MSCQDIIQRKGPDSKYARDCLVRSVRGLPYDDACKVLGYNGQPPIVIHAGIGTLVLGPDGEDFTPAPTLPGKARSFVASFMDRSPADPEEVARRLAVCHTCVHWSNSICRACGCGTKAKSALKSQRCPKGLW